jgi:hypothetical protein
MSAGPSIGIGSVLLAYFTAAYVSSRRVLATIAAVSLVLGIVAIVWISQSNREKTSHLYHGRLP